MSVVAEQTDGQVCGYTSHARLSMNIMSRSQIHLPTDHLGILQNIRVLLSLGPL